MQGPSYHMCLERREMLGVLEALWANVKALAFLANDFFWVVGMVPRSKEKGAEHDVADIQIRRFSAVSFGRERRDK